MLSASAGMPGRNLGFAEALAAEAIRLFLVDFDAEGQHFFATAVQLAVYAYDGNESHVYRDVDGRNSFARFIATRIVAEGQWLARDPRAGDSRARYLQYLLESFDHARRNASRDACDVRLVARVALHLAGDGRWSEVMELTASNGGPRVWRRLLGALKAAERDGGASLDVWFREHTDISLFKNPIDPELTLMEVVLAARVRASFAAVTDPMMIVKSIRRPELAQRTIVSDRRTR